MTKNLQSFFVLHGLAKGIVAYLKPKWISELPGCKRKKGQRESYQKSIGMYISISILWFQINKLEHLVKHW